MSMPLVPETSEVMHAALHQHGERVKEKESQLGESANTTFQSVRVRYSACLVRMFCATCSCTAQAMGNRQVTTLGQMRWPVAKLFIPLAILALGSRWRCDTSCPFRGRKAGAHSFSRLWRRWNWGLCLRHLRPDTRIAATAGVGGVWAWGQHWEGCLNHPRQARAVGAVDSVDRSRLGPLR